MRDRTNDFVTLTQQLQAQKKTNRYNKSKKSDANAVTFYNRAKELGRDIASVTEKLDNLMNCMFLISSLKD